MEEIKPCPFCSGEVVERAGFETYCHCLSCGYRSPAYATGGEAIAAHNRVSDAVDYAEWMGRTPEVLAILEKDRIPHD